jgi:short subunit dehydrogenase-like uncharacterized protein
MNPVVLLGATGYTGQLIASRLVRAKVPFTAVGRDPERLRELTASLKAKVTTKVADVTDAISLTKVVPRGTKVIVNTVGPYSELGEPVVRLALDRKAHYLDITGEQHFIRESHWQFNEPARRAQRAIVHAMAFEYAVGDFAARVLAEKLGGQIDLLELFYFIPLFPPSRGTKRSMRAAMSNPVYGYEGGRLVEIRAGTFRKNLHLREDDKPVSALSFPGGEVFTVPQHVPVRSVREYMVMSIATARLLYGTSPAVVRVTTKGKGIDEATQPKGPTRAQRAANVFQIILEGTRADHPETTMVVTGRDVYGLTAALAVHGVKEILAGKLRGVGVLSPAQAFTEKPVWSVLRRAGIEVRFENRIFSA